MCTSTGTIYIHTSDSSRDVYYVKFTLGDGNNFCLGPSLEVHDIIQSTRTYIHTCTCTVGQKELYIPSLPCRNSLPLSCTVLVNGLCTRVHVYQTHQKLHQSTTVRFLTYRET